jgi:NAD(P)-dependent dehydrogenase (short-subunit alcohol dehydrogenase family)
MELSITGATGLFGSQVAQERDGRDIRVNPVAPGAGSIVTAIWNALGLAKEAVDEWTEQTAAEVPLKRFGQPHGLAAIAAFLASHDASYITGVEFNVDGGLGQF